jgi:Rrf2 family protein
MLIDIADHQKDRPVPVSDISRRTGVSVKYLEQLIRQLKKGGILKSVRGPKGGHYLARDPKDINMGEVVELLEGGINLVECVNNPECCEKSPTCRMRKVWSEATWALVDVLRGISVADIEQDVNLGRPLN